MNSHASRPDDDRRQLGLFDVEPHLGDLTADPVPHHATRARDIPPEPLRRTVQEARTLLKALAEHGTVCPCCDQHVKVYRRKLNANMARFLRSLVVQSARSDGAWVPFKECRFKGRDYPYLALWGLAETQDSSDPKAQRYSGFWRPTGLGVSFIKGEISVPSHALVYNNEAVGWSSTRVHLGDVTDQHFDYAELISSTESIVSH